MKTATSTLTLLQPASVDEALRMLEDEGPLVPIAGCTDVLVSANFGTLEAKRFIDLWPLDELARIRMVGPTLSIGARATWTQIIRSPLVRKRIPILIEAARQIGGVQIQNRGTIGGNIANASPAGDSLPALAVADAILVLRSTRRTRRVAFNAFFTGYRKSVLRPDELIVAVEIPPMSSRQWFRKVGTRAAQAISKVVMAGVLEDGAPRIAVGSVAERVLRLPATERVLASGHAIADAQRVMMSEIKPIDDVRSTAEYRRRVCANLLARFWATSTISRSAASRNEGLESP